MKVEYDADGKPILEPLWKAWSTYMYIGAIVVGLILGILGMGR